MVTWAINVTLKRTRITTGSASKGAGRIHRRQRCEKAAQRKNEAASQHIAHEGIGQWIGSQHRNEHGHNQGRDKAEEGRGMIDPGSMLRYDASLVQQLPEVAIGLPDARPAFGLDNRLEPIDDSTQKRSAEEYGGYL